MLRQAFQKCGLADIAEKVLAGERLSADDGLRLFRSGALNLVGWLANIVRERLHGSRAYFVRNQHINYTNVCDRKCRFCSFHAHENGPAPYVLGIEEVRQRVRQALHLPIAEIHVVGGVNPKLPYSYYLDLLRAIVEERPGVHVKAFTMVELQQIRKAAGKPLEEVLAELTAAGLGSMPGGGAEVLSDRLHAELFARKLRPEEWLETSRAVHKAGLHTNASLLYGHRESLEERVMHLVRLRALQDETGGFLSFVPLAFHPEGSQLAQVPGPTACDDLRTIAVSRLMLDNIPHIKAFWVMAGVPVAQAALWYGADDIEGTVLRYEITRDSCSGTRRELTHEELVALVREAGREPVERIGGSYESRDSAEKPREYPFTAPEKKSLPQEGAANATESHRAQSPSRGGHSDLSAIAARVRSGERLSAEEGVALLRHPNLPEIGALATRVRERLNPGRTVTYVIGRNINYTNVCWVQCGFCTFHRRAGDAESYVLPAETIHQKVEELLALGGTEVLLQGGLNPALKIEWYEELLRGLKERYPVHLHALSPPEVLHLARMSQLSISEVLTRLKAAGLDSLPGGGAEVLVDSVRERVSPRKARSEEWLGVMREAHRLGIPTTATMVYGFGESAEERIEHLLKIRELQDETGGFTAFIAWSFQPEGTALGGRRASGYEYLRMVATARLLLDNMPHIQASWLTQGPKIGQAALHFGVDDFGSTVLEENVISAPGARFLIPLEELERLIRAAGYEPRRRNTRFELTGSCD
jgi:dehypoxanthine futalosine cyclase/putative menaquinone biosynthesis radical SAM enzyme